MFSVIVPVYKSESNLPDLLDALHVLDASINEALEVVFVVDASPDRSYDLLHQALQNVGFRAKLILLTKNEGSFVAIRAGLSEATGQRFGMLAADLQEPIEVIVDMYNMLIDDRLDVVIASRASREDRWLDRAASNLFWSIYRRLVMPTMPPGGFDTFVCHRAFRDQILNLQENHTSLVAQILWLGGRRGSVSYVRQQRQNGTSAWTLKKKVAYLADSVFSFTNLPIQVLTYFGGLTAVASAIAGAFVVYARLSGLIVVPGYTALALLITFFGSSILYGLGIVGSYAWRAYENTKRRPHFTIQAQTHFDPVHRAEKVGT